MGKGKDGFYCKYVKRSLDIVCVVSAMIVFCWLYAIIALLVKIKLGSPVIYKAKRIGKGEKSFMLYKFRSMSNEKNKEGQLLPDTERLTKFGRILRASSLDELPEAWCILKGDMSVIGPRPLPPEYLPYYTAAEHHRHDVMPGLSGLAQVSGRNALSWDKKFEYDLNYVSTVSFTQDVKIIFLTVKKVLVHEGIGQGEEHPGNLYDVRKDKSSMV